MDDMGISINGREFSLREIAKITGGEVIGNPGVIIRSVSTDSRETMLNDLFVAIKGERLDGHAFVGMAFVNGAKAALVDRVGDLTENRNLVLVDNTTIAFGRLAKALKDEINPISVAVTGSVGKTTTKQFIYSVLRCKYTTEKGEKNYNNEIGTPITMLSMKQDCEAAVFEMGMSARGEIRYLTNLVQPDIGIITNIGTCHIEHLGSREAIRDAKLEIVEGIKKNGILILNGDEPLLAGIEPQNGLRIFYVASNSEKADFRITNVRQGETKTVFDIIYPDGIAKDITAPALGIHIALDAAFAFAVGYLLKIPTEDIKKGISDYTPVGMRQNIVCHDGITFIHDYYNAGPESMKASLSVLVQYAKLSGGRSVAVLGDMRELGELSVPLHKEVGRAVKELGVDILFTFGHEASAIADGAEESGMSAGAVYRFTDLDNVCAFGNAVGAAIKCGDAVLLKASRAVALERVIKYLTGKEN